MEDGEELCDDAQRIRRDTKINEDSVLRLESKNKLPLAFRLLLVVDMFRLGVRCLQPLSNGGF